MVLLAVGLLSFLAEISISTQYLRRGLSIALEESESASKEEDA
jgi:hypothetical protein